MTDIITASSFGLEPKHKLVISHISECVNAVVFSVLCAEGVAFGKEISVCGGGGSVGVTVFLYVG